MTPVFSMNVYKRTVKAPELTFHVLNDKKKLINLTYKGRSGNFQLKVKRSFTVLKAILNNHPNLMNIHSLDSILNDPNKALSELKISDGFDHFLIIEKKNKVVHVKLDIEKLFNTVNLDTDPIRLYPADNRITFTKQERQEIYDKFKGKCNITGIQLFHTDDFPTERAFMKNAMIPAYDHRQPLKKTGSNQLHNLQLLSQLANQEKNKICNACANPKCEICALAHPERTTVIYPTNQDIKNLRRNGK